MHTSFPKPARGTALLDRRRRRQTRDTHEKTEKQAVRKRDGNRCRWPRCEYRAMAIPIEVAHLRHKGMGANPANDRSERHLMLCLCRLHHQGAISLDSGDLHVAPLTGRGTNGPLAFYRQEAPGKTVCVGVELTNRGGLSVTESGR